MTTSSVNPNRIERASCDVVTLPCIHCGEPTVCSSPTEASDAFCCKGCQAAYQLIHGWGLQDFYALRAQSKLSGAARAAAQSARYEQFDSDDYLGKSAAIENQDGSRTVELAVHGLHCGACAWLIENAAQREPGLLAARVKMSRHTIQLIWDPRTTQLSRLACFLDRLGYQLSPFDPSQHDPLEHENRRQLIQIAIAGFLAANAMWIAVALYAGHFSGVALELRYFLGLVGTTLGTLSVLGPGRTFFNGALAALRTRTPHMDLPVALGLAAGTSVGIWNAVLGRGDIYFDSVATLVFLLLIGRWIQIRQQHRAARAVDLMLRLTPRHAVLESTHGDPRTVLVDSLLPGDIVLVAPGDCIPADGEVISGETKLDGSLLTGESSPVPARIGDLVAAGTFNLVSPIRIRVSAIGRDSRIGKVMESVEAAVAQRTPIVMLADRIGGYFVVAVTVLAAIAFVCWWPAGFRVATSNATALLIVACPCALALATPLAIAVGLGRAARAGILIRDGSSLQQLARTGRLWFDKTGTLTEGKQRVTSRSGSEHGLQLAASLEAHSKHPIAMAIRKSAELQTLPLIDEITHSRASPGGILGMVGSREVVVGNESLMEQERIVFSEQFRKLMHECVQRGESPVMVGVDGQVITVLGISDPLRTGARTVVQRLMAQGWQVGILSGDHVAIVAKVARELGIRDSECHGGLSPEEKLAVINQSRSRQEIVAMVGDGANDAAALAGADIGIAVRGGAEVSLQAAPVYVASGKIQSLLQLIQGSRRTTRLIWATFAISLAYNCAAVGLALAGQISPLVAAVLMPISSVSVLAVTLSTKTFTESAT